MQAGLDAVLWQDLADVQGQTSKAVDALQAIVHAIQEGKVGQPTPTDSRRLDRLMVLAELLYNEVNRWSTDLDIPRNGNGKLS